MQFRNRLQVHIHGDFYLLLAFMILLLPIRWIFGFYLAAAIHELFHMISLLAFGGEIMRISVRASGTYMEIVPPGRWKLLICTFAGPLGGICTAAVGGAFPELAICALVQSTYNLLPIWPLDGGRAARIFLEYLAPNKVDIIESFIGKSFVILGICGTVLVAIVFRIPLLILMCAITLLINCKKNTLQRREEKSTIVLPLK